MGSKTATQAVDLIEKAAGRNPTVPPPVPLVRPGRLETSNNDIPALVLLAGNVAKLIDFQLRKVGGGNQDAARLARPMPVATIALKVAKNPASACLTCFRNRPQCRIGKGAVAIKIARQ